MNKEFEGEFHELVSADKLIEVLTNQKSSLKTGNKIERM